jgi:glycosyltransferase involved in cell wall biosynthesis
VTSLSILMPVYNERATIEEATESVRAVDLPIDRELIIVDDGSTDGTREWLTKQTWPDDVRVVLHERNEGKGAAVRTGLAAATGTYTTILDADLEYKPEDVPSLLAPILRGDTEVVYGVRGFQAHSAYSFWYVLGNKVVTFATNVLYNAWLSDIMTCQKLLSTRLFRSLDLRENGFAIEAEITARLLTRKERVFEVPIAYRARTREEGKKLTTLDGLRVLKTIARCRIDGRR